jgi:predicted RNase H-like nuclease
VPVIEVHPEVSFATLAGTPLPYSKKCWAGMVLRRGPADRRGIAVPDDLGDLGTHAGVDDVLDAGVAAWSAGRHAAGQADCHPDPPQTFSDGPHAAIRA